MLWDPAFEVELRTDAERTVYLVTYTTAVEDEVCKVTLYTKRDVVNLCARVMAARTRAHDNARALSRRTE